MNPIDAPMDTGSLAACAACGSTQFAAKDVLWPRLVAAWELTPEEERYINRQQGVLCRGCGNNLRMIALAAAMRRTLRFSGTLADYCRAGPALRLLEINTAGFLTQFLRDIPGHRLVQYPEFDMMNLALDSESFDLVLHSDTLEHVPDPVRGLSECRRVLRKGGRCIFTVPLVVDRMTRSREGLPPIHHGAPGTASEDQLVRTEFGADTWQFVIRAGFESCDIVALEYPAAISFVATA